MIDALATALLLLPADEPPSPTPTPTTTVEPKVNKAPPLAEVYAGDAKIRPGMQGKSVQRIQEHLNGVGKPAPVTGVYDKATQKAYESFQEKFDYFPSGIVTEKPALKLKDLYGNGKLPRICQQGTVICIDKTQLVLRQLVGGEQRLVTDVRFGAEQTPTRNGTFRVFSKVRYLISTLAGTPMPYSMFFSGGQAIHYSPGFHRDGYNGASLGCVNIRVYRDARQLYRTTPTGTAVHVYRS